MSATSDHLYRGYSLSAERPALVATASYDHHSGLYVSGSAIAAATRHDGAQLTGYQVYGGYARRFNGDSSWEVGVSRTDVIEYFQPKWGVEYTEI